MILEAPVRRRTGKPHHPPPPPGTIAARVHELLASTPKSSKQVSEEAGLGRDAIRDLFRRPDQSPTLRTIEGLADAFHVEPCWLAFGGAPRRAEKAALVPVRGEVAAGLFRLVGRSDEAEHAPSHVPPDSRFPAEAQFDLIARGSSINKLARDGDYLRCVRIDAAPAPAPGDLVIVEQINADGAVEATAKLLRPRLGGVELWPTSDDPRWAQPLVIPSEPAADDKTVRLIAKVLFIHRPMDP